VRNIRAVYFLEINYQIVNCVMGGDHRIEREEGRKSTPGRQKILFPLIPEDQRVGDHGGIQLQVKPAAIRQWV
jgi:hypothetical protein